MDGNNVVCSINSEYNDSFRRELYLSYEYKESNLISIIIHTNEKTSLEIININVDNNGEYSSEGIIWSPRENNIQKKEFDYKQISYCLYSNNNVYLGYTNGSVRQYSFKNIVDTDKLRLEDNYYNEMFGDSQEESDSTEGKKKHWLNSDNNDKINSRLLMKHMGYPICIKENNNKIYVLYDDGILMSTDKEYSKGYNVKRYYETFEGSIYFSLNSKGNYIAFSTNDRRLLISSINNDELENRNNSKILLEKTLFRKTSFESSEKTKNPHNILNTCWSLCDKYLFIPGDTEIRVFNIDDYNKNNYDIKVFEDVVSKTSKVEKSEICLIRVIKIENSVNLNLLLSLDIICGLNIYVYEDGLLNIKMINRNKLNMFDKMKKNSYPISLDVVNYNGGSFLIGIVLNTGETVIREININDKININFSGDSDIKLVNYSSKKSDFDKIEKSNKLLDDIAEVDVNDKSEYSDNIFMKDDYFDDDDYQASKNDEYYEDDIYEKTAKSGVNISDNEYNENDDSDDVIGDDIDDEYEYENWDKKELGKQINYLKKRIEKLKEVINNSNDSQIPVIPGYTGEFIYNENNDSLMEENREHLLCWNHSGYMIYKIDEMNERPMIDLECYNSIDGPKKIKIYDTKGFNMGNVGIDGYILGRKAKSLENGKYIPSILEYRLWRTWGRSDKTGWTKELLVGEDLVCMTCSKDFVAAITSLRYLRVWRNSGINKLIIKLLGYPVSCVSNDDYLFVITQKEPFYYKTMNDYENTRRKHMSEIISGKCNTYEIYIINVNYETIIYNDIMSVSPGTIIIWCGITDKGVPVIKDSSGQTYILSRQWKNQKENWIPCTNFNSIEKNTVNKCFILSLEEDYFNVIKLPEGYDNPTPLMAKNSLNYTSIKIPYNIPILGLPSSIRRWMNIIDNDKTLSECVTNNNIPWEIIDELILKLDIKYNTILSSILLLNESDYHEYEVQLKQYKLQKEKLLMRLYMKLLVKQLVEPAFDVVKMFSYPKSFQIALEQAEKNNERILSNKINQEVQIRSKIEQYSANSTSYRNNNKTNSDLNLSSNNSYNDSINIDYHKTQSNIENNDNNISEKNTTNASNNSILPFNIKSKCDENHSSNKLEDMSEDMNQTIKFYNDVIKKRKV